MSAESRTPRRPRYTQLWLAFAFNAGIWLTLGAVWLNGGHL